MKTIQTANLLLGQQTFDGLGRQLTVAVGGRATHYEYMKDQFPPIANVLPDGNRIGFTYEPVLNNRVLGIQPDGEAANTFTFDPRLALPASASGPLGSQKMTYTAAGQPKTDTWSIDGNDHITTWHHSLSGLLLGFDDAENVRHERRYDAFGRLDQVKSGIVTLNLTYDEFDRPETSTTVDPASGNHLLQTLTYDILGREQTRTFTVTTEGNTRTFVQTLGYSALDQLITRQYNEGSQLAEETFDYDVMGRLTTYTANINVAPTDPFGNQVVRQTFSFNALDGYTSVISTFADGSADTASFIYAADDPTQVAGITHTHASWPSRIDLTYDTCGRVTHYVYPATPDHPALDRTLTWDAQDRLINVDDRNHVCAYRYDPLGQLTDRVFDGTLTRSFFSGGQATHEQTGDQTLRLHGDGGGLFAQSRLAAGVHQATTLLGTDAQGSVKIEADSSARIRRYTAHGAEASGDDNSLYGFAGERRDDLTGWYIPSGYRPYDPIVMGFLSPDSDSPFGQGGLNPYAYCAGDPVNRIDPSGHGWLTWLVAGIGIALAVVGTVLTFGAAAPAFAALAAGGIGALTASGAIAIGAATLSAISLGTGIASTIVEATNKDSKAASILGWVSLGTGLVGGALEMAPSAAAGQAMKLGRTSGRGLSKMHAKSGRFAGSATNSRSAAVQGASEIIHAGKSKQDVVFHKNLWGQGIAAFETHGTTSGKLMNSAGKMVSASEVAATDIAPRLAAINYEEGKAIILLACKGGSNGAAQKVANTLGRDVYGYLDNIYLPSPSRMGQLERSGGNSGFGNIVLRERSFFERYLSWGPAPFPNAPEAAPAGSQLFTPEVWGGRWV